MRTLLLVLLSALRGPQLATGQTYVPFSANVTGGGNSATFSNAIGGDGVTFDHGLVIGDTYEIIYEVTGYTGGGLYVATGGGGSTDPSRTANGTYTEEKQAIGNSLFYIVANSAGTSATVRVLSLRRIRR